MPELATYVDSFRLVGECWGVQVNGVQWTRHGPDFAAKKLPAPANETMDLRYDGIGAGRSDGPINSIGNDQEHSCVWTWAIGSIDDRSCPARVADGDRGCLTGNRLASTEEIAASYYHDRYL